MTSLFFKGVIRVHLDLRLKNIWYANSCSLGTNVSPSLGALLLLQSGVQVRELLVQLVAEQLLRGGGDGEDVRTHSIHAHICSRTFDVTFDMRAYVLTGRTEPLSVGDDHERRPQAGGVVPAVTRVTQQDLEDSKRKPPTSPTGDLTHFVSLAEHRFKLNK